jgi:hypothetical protein
MTVRMSCLCCDVVGVSGVRNKKGMFFQARAFNQDVARRNRRGAVLPEPEGDPGLGGERPADQSAAADVDADVDAVLLTYTYPEFKRRAERVLALLEQCTTTYYMHSSRLCSGGCTRTQYPRRRHRPENVRLVPYLFSDL